MVGEALAARIRVLGGGCGCRFRSRTTPFARSSALGTDVELSLKSFMLPRERPGGKRSMMVGQHGMPSAAPFSVPALPMASDSSELASFKTRLTVAGVV